MFLILDFTQTFKLAIIKNGNPIQKELNTKKNISEILILEVEKFIKKSNVNIKDLSSIYIITGPGSFTGIRSALTFAKSLKLTMKLNLFGLSKFELINYKININKFNKKRRIFLYFKDNQFFSQAFKGFKSISEARLYNLDDEDLKFNDETTYIYDNILFENSLRGEIFQKKANFFLVDYNLNQIKELIVNNMIENNDPKPLYISNYY